MKNHMFILKSEKRVFIVLLLIYLISNSFFLLNYNGIYWDDWAFYNHSYETIDKLFQMHSGYVGTYFSFIHYFLLEIGIYSYRILTFFLIYISAVFIYKILKKIDFFSQEDLFFISVLFLLAPLYSAKIAINVFAFTLGSAIFFFSFYLLCKYLDNMGCLKRILILFLFFTSFLINSILVFYAVVLMYMFYKLYDKQSTFIGNTIKFICTKLDFIVLPIVFYIIKSVYFVPTGLYADYNIISLYNTINPTLYYLTFMDSFIEPIKLSVQNISSFIVIVFILLIVLSNLFIRQNNQMNKKDVYLFILGFIIFFLGAFAYIAVNKLPANYNWSSRFQLLLPLGFSFILYYGIQVISNLLNFKVIVKYFLFLILIFSFMIYHLKEQYKHNIDWMYQQSIIENFRNTSFIENNSTFEVVINLDGKLAQQRTVNFYELNGLSKIAFGKDDKLFFVDYDKYAFKDYQKFIKYDQYNFSLWKKSDITNIEINDNINSQFNKGTKKSLIYFFKLKYLELTNIEEFKKEVKNLVILEHR